MKEYIIYLKDYNIIYVKDYIYICKIGTFHILQLLTLF